MITSRKMQEVVAALAHKHSLVLIHPGAYLRLVLPPYKPLVIEVLHENLVQVAHVVALHPAMRVADPGIVFFTAYHAWVPIEVNQRVGGYRAHATLSIDCADIIALLPNRQAELAGFAELWAANLVGQGWLQDAVQQVAPNPAGEG